MTMSLIRNLSLVAKAVANEGGLEDGQHHLRRVTGGERGRDAGAAGSNALERAVAKYRHDSASAALRRNKLRHCREHPLRAQPTRVKAAAGSLCTAHQHAETAIMWAS